MTHPAPDPEVAREHARMVAAFTARLAAEGVDPATVALSASQYARGLVEAWWHGRPVREPWEE